jgi:hypothetical protein
MQRHDIDDELASAQRLLTSSSMAHLAYLATDAKHEPCRFADGRVSGSSTG